ncbi:hypothetical protein K501DRAFT_225376 [Backusella circina FSU 941]|nr:hypothetical protein K501DRAFT_225376 [Backusella circina FSU 941]
MDGSVSYHFATVKQRRENRHEIDYQLNLRQQPKQSRMCGVGEKADRRPIDPPPIVQLKVFDNSLPPNDKNYLQNPYYFMYASLMAADLDEELHLLRDGKTRSTTGSVVSSLYHLKDIDNTDAGFFVFPDLSVRMEGSYRLKLSLFEIIGKEVFHCKSIISDVFFVYSAKKFPGMEESTFLSRSFADQGLKIRIRKELRQRRKQSKTGDMEEEGYGQTDQDGKRKRSQQEESSSSHSQSPMMDPSSSTSSSSRPSASFIPYSNMDTQQQQQQSQSYPSWNEPSSSSPNRYSSETTTQLPSISDRRVTTAQSDGGNEYITRDAYSSYPPLHPTQEAYPYRLHNSHDRR